MRFGRRGRRSSASRPEKPPADKPAMTVSTDLMDIDVEHFIPEDEEGHKALSTCACDPIRVVNVRGWYHRSLHAVA